MSINGTPTSLELNVQSSLTNNSGFAISNTAVSYQGFWTPEQYTQGSITVDTGLEDITLALPGFYSMVESANLNIDVYRAALTIGRPVNLPEVDCPALGNSRPYAFQTSYAGYGTWKYETVDQYYNVQSSGTLNMVDPTYPPQDYPVTGNNSYVYRQWGSTTAGSYTHDYQWNYPYSWVIAWPGKSSWQNTDDTYAAAYYPRPDIRVRDQELIEYDEYFKNGFIGTVARQAYYEFWYNYETRRRNQYTEFTKSFSTCVNWYGGANATIGNFVNTKNFIRGTYSNINDLTTADISGVSLSFKLFGNDCIALGKSINLESINRFGLPSALLKNLNSVGAYTSALRFALLLSELTVAELDELIIPDYIPSIAQENKIYRAFNLIKQVDLEGIATIINCTTSGLDSLADLLNPIKMFPNSWGSLTVPRYTVDAPTAKVYDFIYSRSGVNSRIPNHGTYLVGILPTELQIACGAFAVSMGQIKNITSMQFESFAQVVSNLEVTNKDLPLVNNAGTPGNTELANQELALTALGSGNSGLYRLCDFYGAMSGLPYSDYYATALELLQQCMTDNLRNVYSKLYQQSLNNNWQLISAGKGWANATINPGPPVPPEYAYTLFASQTDSPAGSNVITVQLDINSLIPAGSQIAFQSSPTNIYVVTTTGYDAATNTSTVYFSPGLATALPAQTPIYKLTPLVDGNASVPVQDLIDAANLEILRIMETNAELVAKLNAVWDKIGRQLFIEQRAIPYAIPTNFDIYTDVGRFWIKNWVESLSQWALQTQYCGEASVIENISDVNTLGGQSIIASMREARNAQRLLNTFGSLESDVPSVLDPNGASAEICAVNQQGGIETITVTYGGSGYSVSSPPKVRIGPYGGSFGGSGSGATAIANIENGSVVSITVLTSGSGYSVADGCLTVYIDPPPRPERLGYSVVPGSLAGSPYTGQIPVSDNLVTTANSSYTVEQAINEVTICNCDCWNN
jgi:hypothetical protein